MTDMSVPVRVVVVYHSGRGHARRVAASIALGAAGVVGATVEQIAVEDISSRWESLDAADAIIMGAPTYMGGLSAPFKAFMDETSSVRYVEKRWDGKIAAGFTVAGSRGGDKQNSLLQLVTFAAQHQMHWVSLGLGYGNNRSTTNEEILNRDTYSIGMAAQANVDQDADLAPPLSDLRTAEYLGRRVASFAQIVSAGVDVLGRPAEYGIAGGAEMHDPKRRGLTTA